MKLKDISFGEIKNGTLVVQRLYGRGVFGEVVGKRENEVIIIKWSDDWELWPYPHKMCNFEVLK